MHYLDSLTDNLETCILQNWTMQEQVLPISLQIWLNITEGTKDSKGICLSISTKGANIKQKEE